MSAHPECDRMLAVRDRSQTIGEFLEWLQYSGMVIAEWETHSACKWRAGRRGEICERGRVIDDVTGEDIRECDKCNGTGIRERVEARLTPVTLGIERLLARYFDIDLDKVEAERRQILAELQESSS